MTNQTLSDCIKRFSEQAYFTDTTAKMAIAEIQSTFWEAIREIEQYSVGSKFGIINEAIMPKEKVIAIFCGDQKSGN